MVLGNFDNGFPKKKDPASLFETLTGPNLGDTFEYILYSNVFINYLYILPVMMPPKMPPFLFLRMWVELRHEAYR